MPVQFEEDQPFSSTGLPPAKPTGIVRFLMNEGVAGSPKVAKAEIVILTIIAVIATLVVLGYGYVQNRPTSSSHIQYDATRDPMFNVVPLPNENLNQ